MFCIKCGKQLPDGVRFCTSCGCDLNPEYDATASAETTQPQAVEQNKAKMERKKSPIGIILVVIAVAIFAVLALVIKNTTETSEMRKALESNDAATIYYTYEMAIGDEDLIGKYNKMIAEKIVEITVDIDSQDFSEAAKNQGSEAMYEYLNSSYGGLFGGDYTLEDCAYGSNEAEYSALETLIESKEEYLDGIYCFSNAENASDYEEAIECFSNVKANDSDYDAALEKITECSKAYWDLTLKDVEAYIANDDISSAISLMTTAKEYFELQGLDSAEIQAEIDSTLVMYAQKYADKAETAFAECDADAAVGNISVAIELQPDNAEYKAKKAEYEMYLPYELYIEENVLDYEENGDFWGGIGCDITETANDGSDMPHSITWYNNSDDATVSMSAIYKLDGKYNTVAGTLFLFDADKSTDFEGYFVVYGDGDKIYTSPKVTGGVTPQDVSFDVSNVQTLEIAFFGQGTGGFLASSPSFGVSNLVAQKDFP